MDFRGEFENGVLVVSFQPSIHSEVGEIAHFCDSQRNRLISHFEQMDCKLIYVNSRIDILASF